MSKLDGILKGFLDETDYVLEAPIEQADDKDFYDRPYVQAKAEVKALMLELIQEAFDKDLSTKQLMQKVEDL